jgi:hypothetical protein
VYKTSRRRIVERELRIIIRQAQHQGWDPRIRMVLYMNIRVWAVRSSRILSVIRGVRYAVLDIEVIECGLTIQEPTVIGKVFNNMINGTDKTK